MKKKIDFVSIVFYVFAVLLLAYFMWSLLETHTYIQDGIAMGQVDVDSNLFQVVGFYMTGSINYLVYALIVFGVGEIIRRVSVNNQNEAPAKSKSKE